MGWTDSFSLTYAFMILMSSGTSNGIYAFAMERIFPAWDRRAYWTVQVVLVGVAMIEKQLLSVGATFVIGTVLIVAPTYLFLKGPLFSKTVVNLVMMVAMFAAEFPTSWVWIVMTGLPVMDFEIGAAHLLEYVSVIAVHAFLMTAFCGAVVLVCKRMGIPSRSQAVDAAAADRIFPLFLAVQFLLVFLQAVASATFADDEVVMAGFIAPLILFVVTDAILLKAMRDQAEKAFADLDAELLQERADGYLAAAAEMQQSLAEAAVLRHDLRNHLQVVEGLCERGEREEAQAYLSEAAHLL